MTDVNKRIRELQQEIIQLRRRMEQRPVIFTTKAQANYYTVAILDGNTIDTGQDGIKYYEGEIASVPSQYDPDVDDSFTDGIGRGTLYKNGVAQDGYVLVVNDDRGSFQNALVVGDVIYAGGPVHIPVSGGDTSVVAWTAG